MKSHGNRHNGEQQRLAGGEVGGNMQILSQWVNLVQI